MNRRRFLACLGAGGALSACEWWPGEGLWNPCPPGPLPPRLANHELVQAAWEGVEPDRVWDCHVHLLGTGQGGTGAWINPDMQSLRHPVQFTVRKFLLNAVCAETAEDLDAAYWRRLEALQSALPPGARAMLLAFDLYHDGDGRPDRARSVLYVPNRYALALARRRPERFEWIASIHPYRKDAVARLRWCAARGARAVKWLPQAMGIDPASPRCDAFYAALHSLGLPLLTHAGGELAVRGAGAQHLGNPLRLRRPLDHGVRVIVAHCATFGRGRDLDRGPRGPERPNFELFARLMAEPRYEGRLWGDISSIAQVNRVGQGLDRILRRREWHPRLLNGSDYPLPGVLPVVSLGQLVARDLLPAAEARVLAEIRPYNPLLFDFVLKRRLRSGGRGFGPEVFHTRRHFRRSVKSVIK